MLSYENVGFQQLSRVISPLLDRPTAARIAGFLRLNLKWAGREGL